MDRDDDLDEFGLRDVEVTTPALPMSKSSISTTPSQAPNFPVSFTRSTIIPGLFNNTAPKTLRTTQKITIGTGLNVIKPGASETISVSPQGIFRMEKFFATESVQGSTVIENIYVGNDVQFPPTGGVASQCFDANVFGNSFTFGKTKTAEMKISFVVKNISSNTVTWSGTVFGTLLDG